ncbi:hypothetical protein BS50DRAFT_665377 [Corynespora cassiicola Philippines]|uniref:Uncharacterized protein n=1 Tax=Corynespora cassiicola Philippines TaxID=1448308 RepID=A0A2T2NRD5_CORCC|nr:hypothetical protein BS50DRAFT_665377 [Corynespora cassiicola Philippines]
MFLFNPKKARAMEKMKGRYGRVGTEEEWRNSDNTRDVYRPEKTVTIKNYSSEFKNEHLVHRGLVFIKDNWWPEFCQSANKDNFYDVLFDQYLFSEDGLLDFYHPAYRTLHQLLVSEVLYLVGYMHIVEVFGENKVLNWKTRWANPKDGVVYILIYNPQAKEQRFGISSPENGWLDNRNELNYLRRDRDKEQIYTHRTKYWLRPEVDGEDDEMATESDSGSGVINKVLNRIVQEAAGKISSTIFEDSDLEVIRWSSPKKTTHERSEIDDEYWFLVDANMRDGPQNNGYLYRVEDSQPTKKHWFSFWL